MTSNADDDSIPPPPSYPPPPSTPVDDLEIQSTPVLERLNMQAAAESNLNDNTSKKGKKKYTLGLILLLLFVGAGIGAALGILLPQTSNGKTNDVELGIYQVLDGEGNIIDFTPSSVPSQSPSVTTIPSLSPSHIPTIEPTTTPSSSPTETRSLSFFAIGDVPYSDLEACLIPHELDKAANSGADAKFMLHLGDIRDGKPYEDWEWRGGQPRPCPEYLFEDVATIFEMSHVPTFFSMGDNAWLDCEDVDEAYKFWEKHLLTFDERKDLGWPELGTTVSRNEDHIEMYSFVLKDVLVIGQGLPGEGRGVDHAWTLWNVYLDENARWLEKSFAENEFKSVIIVGNSSAGWNERYFLRLEEVARQHKDIPIMFLGDGHDFEEEAQFRGLPNLHRIALDDVVTPTLITVDPYATGNLNVFTYDRRCPCAGNHRPTELFNYTSGVCAGVCDSNDLCINEDAESVLWGEE
eukprot:scaffold2330_cov136-Skeletonema_menzelii.AAC.10